ncbi:Glutamine--tRNA ligase, cytoplasmic [Orobanche gracilis]
MVGKSESDGGGDRPLDWFLRIGLDERTAKNTIANNKVTANLTAVIHEVVATKFPANALVHRPTLLKYIVSLKIKTPAQLEAAFSFLAATASDDLNIDDFEAACGVGVEVSLEDIEHVIDQIFEENKAVIVEQRYRTNVLFSSPMFDTVGDLFGYVRKKQPWADPKIVKAILQIAENGDLQRIHDNNGLKWKDSTLKAFGDKALIDETVPEEEINPFSIFPSPDQNFKVHTEIYFSDRPVLRACNSNEILDKHLKITGGKFFTRFPPEPNGYLHIGHAKAMFVDFGLAKEQGGCCYLRYDDTNPEAEKKEYIDHIEEIVGWMGWKPFKITYSSDYFEELYKLALELIRRGHAYVDHQTPDEIKHYRENKMNSPWRERAIEESLKLFDDMKKGLIEEGKATLRMKQDMKNDNVNMYDLIAYRIKFTPHPHAGDKWCIYPSYDYTHCIVDSLENITHSLTVSKDDSCWPTSNHCGVKAHFCCCLYINGNEFSEVNIKGTYEKWKRNPTFSILFYYSVSLRLCTLEFETRRASYYWLLDALGLYQPYVWEYSRLNVSNTVMSKRKLNRLVTEKWVDGWDDPRLMTLAGLRRRGVTASAINAFVRGIGITRSDSSMIRLDRLEYHVREELNKTAPRVMVVLDPVKVVITYMDTTVMDLDAKKWPIASADDASSFYKVPFSKVVYIEKSDFRTKDSKDYYGLAPGKSVLLRYAFPIKCTEVILSDDKETILEIRAEYDPSKKTKPKGVLHWVAESSLGIEPLKVEVRLFDKLFNSENPAELEEKWLGDLNPHSKVVLTDAYAVPSLRDAAIGDSFQFERLGYFVVDKDTMPGKLVFNRTVTLRDSYGKGGK